VRLRALAVLALLFGILTQAAPAHAENGQIGDVAPPFAATPLDGGAPVALADLRGKTVLLNKWSTWCRPCVQEMPDLERLYQRHRGSGLVVVGVSVDRPGMSGAVRNVASKRGTTYPIWLDPADEFTQTFHSTGVPESILLDRRGAVVMRWPGVIDVDDPESRLDLDDLRTWAARGIELRSGEAAKVRVIVAEEVERYLVEVTARQAAPLVAQLRERVEAVRVAELDRHTKRLAGLTDEQRDAVESLTRALVNKLLHEPSVRLKDDAGTPRGERNAAAVRDLFGLP